MDCGCLADDVPPDQQHGDAPEATRSREAAASDDRLAAGSDHAITDAIGNNDRQCRRRRKVWMALGSPQDRRVGEETMCKALPPPKTSPGQRRSSPPPSASPAPEPLPTMKQRPRGL
jgi:hypothetical protein